jgi:hypothetical protein
MLKTGSCSGYGALRAEKAPDNELGAMGLLGVSARADNAW